MVLTILPTLVALIMFGNTWSTLRNLGIGPSTPLFEVRNTRLVTYICLTSMATTSFYGLVFLILGDWISATVDLAMAGLFSAPLFLLAQHRLTWAKWWLILGVNLGTLLIILVYGPAYSNELFFVLTAMLGCIVFKERGPGLLGFIVAMAFYGASVVCTRLFAPWVELDPAYQTPLHIVGLISVAGIAYLLMEYIRSETQQFESTIIDARDALEQEKSRALDSLHYAASIQKAILGTKQSALTAFRDGFILYRPKDFVSGDFFWWGDSDGVRILAGADCTGHGVPAALMTIMGHDLLNDIVLRQHVTDTREIIRALDKRVTEKLSLHPGSSIHDGMDIAIIAIHQQGRAIQFSGAKSDLHLVHDGTMTTTKGSRFSVGSNLYETEKTYPSTILEYEEGDRLYLFSDGFQDQFGGPRNKKYLRRRFRELLCATSDEGMAAQKATLEAEFKAWRGDEEQTDDVLVIGLQL